ncbi:hypothetical protein [Leisingera sp. S232]|uniref:hypothetical protein n=1 Tax=Leisingera sp. S232 TaxID=3415132 RepID=UPI00086B8243|nr:hypothetical protein AB838_13610 [Rhodobacteraceae bacterium (ex Bugula neritina AB1)]
MTKLQNKLRRMRLLDLIRQRSTASQATCNLRVSRLAEEDGEEAVLLRTQASLSLTAPYGRRI